MSEPKAVGTVRTNTVEASLARVAHAPPVVELHGRVAGDFLGSIWRDKPALHFTVIISDPYSGLFGMDGQPTFDTHFHVKKIGETLTNFGRIRVSFHHNELPVATVVTVPISPPEHLSAQVFAQSLVRKAYDFASYSLPYSLPKRIVRDVMVKGHYNSSSFAAGLLNCVMGYVPKIATPGFETPGWDQPIPASYFKGEAIR